MSDTTFHQSLIAGAAAGTSVDLFFYPLDTLKTRLQSKAGFNASGGFKGVYRGLGSVVVGSAPGSALFFVTYDGLKTRIPRLFTGVIARESPVLHMLAASGGEMAACLVRVPTEVVKQRQQTSAYGQSSTTFNTLKRSFRERGIRGLYRGYGTTVLREIPFSCLQFPVYERLKLFAARRRKVPIHRLPAPDAAVCGCISGGFAAAVTTPLDVAKTRIMLNRDAAVEGTWSTLLRVASEEGRAALFRGVWPRTFAMATGGYIFLGMYELVKARLD